MAAKPVVEIRYRNENLTDEQRQQIADLYINLFMEVYEIAVREGAWRDEVEKIVFTDRYHEDIKAQSEIWGVHPTLSAHKEYIGVSKCLYNHNVKDPKWQVFIPIVFTPTSLEWKGLVLDLLIGPASRHILPDEFEPYQSSGLLLYNFYDYVRFAVSGWCPAFHARVLWERIVEHKLHLADEQSLFNLFARKLKRALYAYNANPNAEGLSALWDSGFAGLYNLVLRSIDIYSRKGEVKFADPAFGEIVMEILKQIKELTSQFAHKQPYDTEAVAQGMLRFLLYFHIEIRDIEKPDQFYIHLPKNPKDYFKNLLVDTEPRMVCFMDILGFSDMIEEYETDDLSTVLQDIQKAFNSALSILRTQTEQTQGQEFLQYLEYKTFSDNICISFPYFDNQTDFLANLNLMIVFLRGLQYSLMTLGFFTRGGLTIGSYYSDQNMIFSKALVDAYHLESRQAKYPRILVADSIMKKLKTYQTENVRFYNLERSIIHDRDFYLINPFLLLSDTSQMVNNLFDPALYGETDNELTAFFKSMTSQLGAMLNEQLAASVPADDEQLQKVASFIAQNKERFKDDRKTLSKYIWIDLLCKWSKGDTSVRRFGYFKMPVQD